MRLLHIGQHGELSLSDELPEPIPPYAILSHTWGTDDDEVSYGDLKSGSGKGKSGYAKITFCAEQARKDGLQYFWVDTCCIDKANLTELSENITSMFRWYRDAVKCYVYLSDVSADGDSGSQAAQPSWVSAFRNSRWFTRGWTLQELLAPKFVNFFSKEGVQIGDKNTLEIHIYEITGVPILALRGGPLSYFSVEERLQWAAGRQTKKKEDRAYCLLGIFNVFLPLIYGEGDHAFVRLQQAVGSSLEATDAGRGNVHWTVMRSCNNFFTGREEILLDLETAVRAGVRNDLQTDQCRVVITGIGGQGKSEICLQLVQRVRKLFWGVFWVDVSTVSLAHNAFLGIAARLQIPAQSWEQGRQMLANIDKPWILVLDNADDPNVDYQEYFPAGRFGVVVLNSRNYECQQFATARALALDGLPISEAKDLLLKAARIVESERPRFEEDATQVALLLQSHALALTQAGAYVARGHCSLAQYYEVYQRQRHRLLQFRPSQAQSRYRDVYATFEASVDLLQAAGTEAAEDALLLLPMLAACAPNRIPLILFEEAWTFTRRLSYWLAVDTMFAELSLLTHWHIAQLPPLMQTDMDQWDSFRLREAVHTLKALALISTDTSDDRLSVSMHPLVHAWARDRQDEAGQRQSWLRMASLLAISGSDNSEFWRANQRQLLPHLQAVTSWELPCILGSEPLPSIIDLWIECGRLLYHMRDDMNLSQLLQRLFAYLKWDSLIVNERWVAAYELVGRTLSSFGQFNRASYIMRQISEIRETTMKENHPAWLRSQQDLATVYLESGQIKDAVEILERLVEEYTQTWPKDHASRMTSEHELSIAYMKNGQVDKATTLLERIVKDREQTLKEEDSFRLSAEYDLAIIYWERGQREAAMRIMERVVKLRRKTLDEQHAERVYSEDWLMYMQQAENASAESSRIQP